MQGASNPTPVAPILGASGGLLGRHQVTRAGSGHGRMAGAHARGVLFYGDASFLAACETDKRKQG